ncbi:MAG: PQQ-binding-like beta-propeller repeat protein [Planctomycetes bacterium]|nr:PQQ-binding-like beta-propeller repeat protein [Planctomycetota bacterium]
MKRHRGLSLMLIACAAAALVVAALPAARVAAQDANVRPQGEGQAAPPAAGDEFVPQMNTSTAAERDLRVARDLAAAGAYGEAAQRYVELLSVHADAMSAYDERLHLPVWRLVVEDVLGWPADGQQAYRDLVTAEARQQWTLARREGDLSAVEQVAHRWFLSDVGDDAAVALADRLREAGLPALALYYYKLVLDKHRACDLPREQLLTRAALTARAAGIAELADELAAALDGATVRTDVAAAEQPAAQWVRGQPLPPSDENNPSTGRGLRSEAEAVDPAAVIWQDEFLRSADPQVQQMQNRVMNMNRSGVAAAPPVMPVVRDGTVYAARLHTAWALDAGTGELLWRHDTRETDATPLPVQEFQARQPLVVDDVVYVPLEEPSENSRNIWMFNQGQGGMRTSLYALSASSGLVLWSWNPREAGLEYGELSVDGMPVVSDDMVVVTLGSPGTFYGEVYTAALDRYSGKLLWSQSVVGYSAGYIGQENRWSFNTRNVSASVAVRDGLVLVNALGTTAAQSLLSGRLLWARTMQDLRQIPIDQTDQHSDANGRLPRGAYLARLPRVLADRGLVASGCVLSPHLEAYRWLDGSLAWRRPSDDAPYLLAMEGRRGVAWGSKVLTFDLATGESPWQAVVLNRPPTAEPLLARGKLLVPTTSGIFCVNLATGHIETHSALPAGFTSGNLALGPAGLVVTTDSDIVNYLDWETARRQFTDQAAAQPDAARPWMTLGAAALRLDRTDEGLGYLDKALARAPTGDEAAELYQLYEDYYHYNLGRLDADLAQRLAERMKSSAVDADSICRQALLRAEALADRNARAAVAALQEILDGGPELRHVQVSLSAAEGVSGILAEQSIARLIERHGRAVYAPWDALAVKACDAARRAADYDALIEVACRWPNSLAAAAALDDALNVALARDDLNEAGRLLVRMVNLTAEGRRRNRYRALSLQVSRRLGQKSREELQALALAAKASPDEMVPSLDGGNVRIGDLTAGAPQGNLVDRGGRLPTMPDPPYRLAWRLELDSDELAQLGPIGSIEGTMTGRLLRSVSTGDGDVLLLANRSLVTAVRRSDGRRVWTYRDEPSPDQRNNRVLAGRDAVYLLDRGGIGLIDPRDGTLRWRVALQPQQRRAGSPSPETVTGALRYGDAGFVDGTSTYHRVTELGDLLAVSSHLGLHLLDTRDGYAIRAIGYPQGIFHGGFQFCGRWAWGVPMQPTHMRRRVLTWDLATGDLEREACFAELLLPSPSPPPGSRYWPIFSNAMDQVAVLDAATGTVGPLVSIADNQARQFYQRSGVVEDGVLIMVHPNEGLSAVDTRSGKLLWTYDTGTRRQVQFHGIDAERMLVWGDFAAVAMLRRSDGHELWRIGEPDWQRAGVSQIFANRFMLAVNKKAGGEKSNYQAVHDLETGARTFLLERPDGTTTGAAYADAAGMLVRGGPNDPLEYWVSDAEGTWKDRSPDDPPPEAPPSDEPAAEDNGNGADPDAAPGAVRVRVRIQGGAGQVEVED